VELATARRKAFALGLASGWVGRFLSMVIVVGNRCSVPNGPRRGKEFLTGSATGAIRLNTDLAKKPPECLEYIVVHELAHLIEPSHNARFVSVMDLFLPQWQLYRDELNRLPVRHEEWSY